MLPDKPYKLELPDKPYKLELPEEIQEIIRAFSRPLTRPDWRSIHRDQYFYEELLYRIRVKKNCKSSCIIQ